MYNSFGYSQNLYTDARSNRECERNLTRRSPTDIYFSKEEQTTQIFFTIGMCMDAHQLRKRKQKKRENEVRREEQKGIFAAQ